MHRHCTGAFDEEALRLLGPRELGNTQRHTGTTVERARDPGLKFAPAGKIIVSRCLAPSERSIMLSFRGRIRRDLTVRKISKGFRINPRVVRFSHYMLCLVGPPGFQAMRWPLYHFKEIILMPDLLHPSVLYLVLAMTYVLLAFVHSV